MRNTILVSESRQKHIEEHQTLLERVANHQAELEDLLSQLNHQLAANGDLLAANGDLQSQVRELRISQERDQALLFNLECLLREEKAKVAELENMIIDGLSDSEDSDY